jgi:SAM-dependent methyltransferase
MSLVYRAMYRVGFVPWDTGEVPAELGALVEGGDALPAGRALDIGCGTGTQAVHLAALGWQVTAIDNLSQPLRRARARAAASKVSVDWRQADATRLSDLGLATGFTLVFDRGCYHGLSERQRDAYAVGITAVAAPGATVLMMAFAPNRVPLAPAGADEAEIATRFSGWELRSVQPDSGPSPPGPLHDVPRNWYRLLRR